MSPHTACIQNKAFGSGNSARATTYAAFVQRRPIVSLSEGTLHCSELLEKKAPRLRQVWIVALADPMV